MNNEHLQDILNHYIDKFELINDSENREYYKWHIANRFHDEMDKALGLKQRNYPLNNNTTFEA